MTGLSRISVMRTRQASARAIGTFEYLSRRVKTGSRCSVKSNATARASRRRSSPRLGTASWPARWYASERTASQVAQGGGNSAACVAAHSLCVSRFRIRATRKPESTRTVVAIAGNTQIVFFASRQIRGQVVVHRADKVGDSFKRRTLAAPTRRGLETFANNVRLRDSSLAGFGLDLSRQWIG